MGYCPYYCIVCKDVEDNGWYKRGEWIHEKFDLNEVKNVLKVDCNLDKGYFIEKGIVYTYSICTRCSHKFRYEKDKLNGSCLKMYTKKKLNGKWVKL